jgi:enediyne biosynthesis protein E4
MIISRRNLLLRSAALTPYACVRRLGWASTDLGPIRMTNGAAASGLDFVLRNSAQGQTYQVETLPGGLGVIDFDNDGWPDIFCVNGAALPSMTKTGPEYWNRLYRNNRDGTFSDVTSKSGLMGHGYGMGVAVGDYNNDGYEDLFVAGVHGNQLYRNNGNGTFSDVTEQARLNLPAVRKLWSIAAAWIDYDNDGRLDLFISNYCNWDPGTDQVCGGMAPNTRVYCHPDRYQAETMQLFHNNGDGTFSEVTHQEGLPNLLGKGMGIAMTNFYGDRGPGLFVANDNARNLLLRSTSHGLEEVGLEAGVAYNGDGRNISGMGAVFGDVDGDGLDDLIMTGLRNETYELFLNRGDGAFVDGSASTGLLKLSLPWSGWGCGLVDLDNDGWLDLFVACGGLDTDQEQPNRIFRNLGGKFIDTSQTVGAGFGAAAALHRGVVFADFDRDGRIDAAVTALNKPIELWWNRSPERNWLQLRLRGKRSNGSAIGAQVTCKTLSRTQSRCVTNTVGYASSSDLTVHFGLDADTKASVKIRWPSGTAQDLGEVAANQRMRVQEPG